MHLLSVPLSVVICASLVAAVTDLRQFRIYNALTLPLILSGVVYHAATAGWIGFGQSVAAAVLCLILLLFPYWLGAMGAGDVKLMAGVGAWLGLPWTIYVLFASSIASGVYAVVLLAQFGGFSRIRGNFQALYYKVKALSAHIGPEENIEVILAKEDRHRRAIPYGAMVAVGVLVVWYWFRS